MTAQERIKTLLQQWVASTRTGRPIPLPELCKDCPELLPEVKKRIEKLIADGKVRKAASANEATHSPSEPDREGTHLQSSPPPSVPVSSDGYPTELGGYKLTKVLGEGGMGRVYLAQDPQLDRQVAVKVMKPEIASNPQNRTRFLREARATAQLEHDHIIAIFQVGEERQIPFLVMPLLKGEALDSRLKRDGKLSLKEALRIAREMAEGLAAAHERGLIHRDIKPANVWLDGSRSRVKILDFGLAKGGVESGGQENLTQSGAVMGTPAYMAPEQARGIAVDHRADLFSLGSVLYQMLTGKRPFSGSDAISILTSLAMDTPTAPHELDPVCPQEVSQLTMRLLAKNPDERPGTADEVVETVGWLESQLTDSTRSIAPVKRPSGVIDRTELTSGSYAPAPPTPKSGGLKKILFAVIALLVLLPVGWLLLKEPSGGDPEQKKAPKQLEVVEPKKPPEAYVLKLTEGNCQVLFPQLRHDETKPVTIEFWTLQDTGRLKFFLQGRTKSVYLFRLSETEWRVSLVENTMGAGSSFEIPFEKGKWMHLAAVIDEGSPRLFVNGKPVSGKTGKGGFPQSASWATHLGYLSQPKKDLGDLGPVTVRALRITQSARYTDEFKPPEKFEVDPNTVAMYDFTDGPGTTLADRSGKGNDGTVVNAEWVKLEAKQPAAIDFDRRAAEYVVSVGGIVRIDDQMEEIKSKDKLPATKFRLTYVSLRSSTATDQGLSVFEGCSHLTGLNCLDSKVGDAGMVYFKDCKKLRELILANCNITDAGLVYFKDCSELEELNLHLPSIKGPGLVHFKNCTKLKKLTLGDAQTALNQLKGCLELESISLYYTTITDAELARLKGYPNLTYLRLDQCFQITDAGMQHLKDCKRLTYLDLDETKLTDRGLAPLQGLSELKTLRLLKTSVTAAGVAELEKALPGCKVVWDGLPKKGKKK